MDEGGFVDWLGFTSIKAFGEVFSGSDKVAVGFGEGDVSLFVDLVGSIVESCCECGASECCECVEVRTQITHVI